MKNIDAEMLSLMNRQASERKREMDTIKSDLSKLETLIEGYSKKVDEASQKKLDLQTEEAV